MSKDKALEALNEMYAVLNDSDRWCEHKRIIIEALQSEVKEVTPTKSAKEMFEELDLHIVKENEHYIKYQLYTSEMLKATDCNSFNLIFQKKKGYYYVEDYDMQVHFTKELNKAITKQLEEIENER